jgi:hypothetical protein
MVAIGDAKTLVDRRARMVETFGKMGVTLAMILGKLEKKTLDDIDLADIGLLIGLHTALKDGETTIDEVFSPPKAAKPQFEAVKPKADPQEVGRDTVRDTLRHDDPNNPPMDPGIADAIAAEIIHKSTMPLQPISPEQSAAIQEAAIARQVAAEPKKRESVRAKAGPVQEPPGPKEMLIAAGVPFDDFTDWMLHSGRNTLSKDWASYDDVPESVWTGLRKDPIGVGKCSTMWGKVHPATEPAQ